MLEQRHLALRAVLELISRPAVSGGPFQGGLHQADMEHVANLRIKIARMSRPQNAQDHAERRVAHKGEQVGTGLIGAVGQNGLADPRKYRGVNPS